jgi:hypothetical protein
VDVSQIYQNPEEKLWLVIKKYQSKTYHKGYRIQKNDIIKVGRIRLRVRDIDYLEEKESYQSQTKNGYHNTASIKNQSSFNGSSYNQTNLQQFNENLMNQNSTLYIQDTHQMR